MAGILRAKFCALISTEFRMIFITFWPRMTQRMVRLNLTINILPLIILIIMGTIVIVVAVTVGDGAGLATMRLVRPKVAVRKTIC